jgi:DNA-binding XRE family transcriptional regulator
LHCIPVKASTFERSGYPLKAKPYDVLPSFGRYLARAALSGGLLSAARKEMGLSVSQLADLLYVNRSTIFRIEQTECTRVMDLAMTALADRWQGMNTAPRDGKSVLVG